MQAQNMTLFLKSKYIYSKWFSYYLIKVKTDFNFAIEQFSKRKIKKSK